MFSNKIAGFSGRLMLGVVLGVAIISSLEGHRAKLINEKIKQKKSEQNKEYMRKLNKSLENIVYTKGKYEDDNVSIVNANKYYYTNIYDLEKAEVAKVGTVGSQKAILTGDKNEFVKNSHQTVTNSNILDQDLSGLSSEFYDEGTVRLNEKIKSFENLKKQLKRMHEEVQATKDFKWPCTLVSYYKDAWGRNFEYIRDKDNKAKIGFSLPWNTSEKVFLDLNLPQRDLISQKTKIKNIYEGGYNNVYLLTEKGILYVPEYYYGWTKESISNIEVIKEFFDSYYALGKTGKLYVKGRNTDGELGIGTNSNVSNWTDTGLSNIKKVEASSGVVYALTKDGELYVTGKNKYGGLGLGHTDPVNKWIKIGMTGIKDIKAYGNLGYLTTFEDKFYVVGFNNSPTSYLGLWNTSFVTEWTCIEDVQGEVEKFVFKYLKMKDGTYYHIVNSKWVKVSIPDLKYMSNKDAFEYIAITIDGKLYKYSGDWVYSGFDNVDKYFNAQNDEYFITEDNKLYVKATNNRGFLGLGHKNPVENWTDTNLTNIVDLKIEFSQNYAVAVTQNNGYYAVGYNRDAQLGVYDEINSSIITWTYIDFIDFETIYIMNNCSFAVKKDGTLMVIGDNADGQLGLKGYDYDDFITSWIESPLPAEIDDGDSCN